MSLQVSKLKSQLEKQRAHLREEHKMEIATINDKVKDVCVLEQYRSNLLLI